MYQPSSVLFVAASGVSAACLSLFKYCFERANLQNNPSSQIKVKRLYRYQKGSQSTFCNVSFESHSNSV